MERLWKLAGIIACISLCAAGCGTPTEDKEAAEWDLVDKNNGIDDDDNNVEDNNNVDHNNHANNDDNNVLNNASNNVANNIENNSSNNLIDLVSCLPYIPTNYRTTPTACDNERAPGNPPPADATDFASCLSDAECTEGDNGRCIGNNHDGWYCTYDNCFEDSDCGGNVCGCGGGFRSDHNVCMSGNCATSEDCPETSYCSPSFGSCGDYSGVVGYFCRTCDDECVDDSDCGEDGGQPWGSYCMFDEGVGHWTCSNSQCAG